MVLTPLLERGRKRGLGHFLKQKSKPWRSQLLDRRERMSLAPGRWREKRCELSPIMERETRRGLAPL